MSVHQPDTTYALHLKKTSHFVICCSLFTYYACTNMYKIWQVTRTKSKL